jgi:hypothetical protein
MRKYGVIAVLLPFLFGHVTAEMPNRGRAPSPHARSDIPLSADGCGKQDRGKKPQFIQGEVLVKFKANVTREEIEGIQKAYGLSLVERIEGTGVYRFKIPGAERVKDVVDALNEDPHVEYAEPNYIVRIQR